MTPPSEPLFLAIDAGGTKTDLLLADSTHDLARVRTGSIKLLNTPADVAEQNLASALDQLHTQTGLPLTGITRTCVGTSGISVPLVANWIRSQIHHRTGGELILCGDEEIALDAAFHGGRGILILAGTGSNAVGRTSTGERPRVGGWGPILADEGSGHWIGALAVRSIFRALDEGRTTTLLPSILRDWNLATLEDLIQRGNAAPPPPFAELTPTVLACAEAGDPIASHVLQLAGEELARLVALVLHRMQSIEQPTPATATVASAGPNAPNIAPALADLPEVALAGSILQSVPPVRRAMVQALQRTWPAITVHPQAVDPIQGALWRARTS